jgi:transcriptional regulator with XRE-family HTH domain
MRCDNNNTSNHGINADRISDLISEYKSNHDNGSLKDLVKDINAFATEHGIDTSITDVALSNYQNNIRTPNVATLLLLVRFFDVSADWLLGISKIRSIEPNIQKAAEYLNCSSETLRYLKRTFSTPERAFSFEQILIEDDSNDCFVDFLDAHRRYEKSSTDLQKFDINLILEFYRKYFHLDEVEEEGDDTNGELYVMENLSELGSIFIPDRFDSHMDKYYFKEMCRLICKGHRTDESIYMESFKEHITSPRISKARLKVTKKHALAKWEAENACKNLLLNDDFRYLHE